MISPIVSNFLTSSVEGYFIGTVPKLTLFSSYYLVGFREGFLISRSATLTETASRAYRFLSLSVHRELEFWTLGWGTKSLPALTWFAAATNSNLFNNLNRTISFVHQDGNCYLFRSSVFTINTLNFLGLDVVFILTPPSRRGEFQVNSLRSFGIPILGLEYTFAKGYRFAYQFFCAMPFSRVFVFYLRLFAYFISQSRRLLREGVAGV